MCGICGVAAAPGQRVDVGVLEAMTATIRHRGPDDQGLWQSPDGRVGFGHRRLAIIDLSPGGHQPMHDPSGRLTIVFNGEIYNFLDLRGELESLGHAFHTQSDTEVILAAYRQWGLAFAEHLNGMFALALHDADNDRLVFARDRAGEKPLFYAHVNGTLLFASELKALMANPSFRAEVDPRALNEYLTYGYVPGALSILRGVRKLPQGSLMTYDLRNDRVDVRRYWRLPPPPNGQPAIDDEALLDELETLLADSVRMRLIADVPVGIMLSGGVDSSLVTAMAARVSSRPVKTFTITFPGHGTYDEAPHARLVAKHFGTDHTELPAEAASVDLLPALARQYDEPMADSSMVPTYLVSRLIRQHATVALGGDGGDELFGGYLHYGWFERQDKIRRLVPRLLRRGVSAAAKRLPHGVRGRGYLIGSAGDLNWSIGHANLFFDVDTRRKLLAPLGIDATSAPEQAKATLGDYGGSAVQRATAVDFQTYLVDDILVKVDRASMLTSLEVRAPLLDPRIIELAYGRTPDRLRYAHGARKILLRRLAERVLPKELDIARKHGFSIPIDRWLRGDWGRTFAEILAESHFDRGVIAALLRGQERGLVNAPRIFSLVMFELWMREYRVSIGGPSTS
ncbi:MAG TPA: asparagine synthase (glutamine-hydrolyzing) [Thermoanaerobaculia bacterium]|nr:asparagine synthase (glutamine-hydrolyzing) [Thermoanaerobaculia bacterium]